MHPIKKAWILSDYVYLDQEVHNKLPEDLVFVASLRHGSDRCFMWKDTEDLHIVFRGSDDLMDWVSNLDAGWAGEHDSISESYESFSSDILHIAKHHLNLDFNICGHSRGGALATFCAEHLSILKPLSCITFGAPAVYRKDGRDHYNRLPIDHTNVYVRGDIVATSKMIYLAGFRHVGKSVVLPASFLNLLTFFRVKAHLRDTLDNAVKKRWK
jgi:pimeloyl-ACP methyl ester carboxylesterase